MVHSPFKRIPVVVPATDRPNERNWNTSCHLAQFIPNMNVSRIPFPPLPLHPHGCIQQQKQQQHLLERSHRKHTTADIKCDFLPLLLRSVRIASSSVLPSEIFAQNTLYRATRSPFPLIPPPRHSLSGTRFESSFSFFHPRITLWTNSPKLNCLYCFIRSIQVSSSLFSSFTVDETRQGTHPHKGLFIQLLWPCT